MDAETEPHTWRMFAGETQGGRLLDFGAMRYVEMHGYSRIISVLLTETQADEEEAYWGWVDADETEPTMIQPVKSMFDMQFAHGPDIEVEKGRGRIVRLLVSVEEVGTPATEA